MSFMKENRSLQPRTSLRQRIILVLFGLSLFFVLLEVGLRLGGFILLSIQEYRNRQTIRQKGTYRIMCLGESTTVDYPAFLEEVLNQRNIGMRFSVIDKGRGGTNTPAILSQIESYLGKYHPDMVVAMMGINDRGGHIPYERPTLSKTMLFIRSFRTYKLARLLWLHMITKAKEIGLYKLHRDKQPAQERQSSLLNIRLEEAYVQQEDKIKNEDALKKALELNPRNDRAYLELGRLYKDQGQFQQAEEYFKKALEFNSKNDEVYFKLGSLYRDQGQSQQAEEYFKKTLELKPRNDRAYLELGRLYRDQGQFQQAEEYFKKTLELKPRNDRVYLELGRLYRDQGQFQQAEEYFKKTLELNPRNDRAYLELVWLYRDQGQFQQAEEYFKKTLELNPRNDRAYLELGRLYKDQGQFQQAEEYFKKTLELNPKNDQAYVELGWVYLRQGQLSQAKECLEKGLAFNPSNERLYGALAVIYEVTGQAARAQEYSDKANELGLSWYKPMTANNYHTLKEILNRRKIQLVCVQYPMRNIEALKKIFQGNIDGILFVDNEKAFKEAVKEGSYKEYFRDMFGGDFGHCTEKGNRLLAGNIANVILKEVFHK